MLGGERVALRCQVGDGRAGDGGPRGLEGGDHVPVPLPVVRRVRLGLVQPRVPDLLPVCGKERYTLADAVEGAFEYGDADAGAPQDARLGALGVGVREGADHGGCPDHSLDVVQVGEGDDAGPHEGAVARAEPGAGGVGVGCRQHGLCGCPRLVGLRGAEHAAGLVPDVARAAITPAVEVAGDLVERAVAGQVGAGGGD